MVYTAHFANDEARMINMIGISGSLRRGSFNSGLLRAAATMMPADSTLAIESIAGIPLYNGDDEAASGLPPEVARLKEAIAAADGVFIATPEYNNGIPGVVKNAIDWLSRPIADIPRVFGGKPAALAGASPGGFGTILAQNGWLPVLRTLGAELWPGRLLVSRAGSVFDVEGNLTDAKTGELLAKHLAGFVAFAASRKDGRARS
jgi:NAD(P)H-dependent FMN reductase